MDDINQMRRLVNQAKREECRASNDMYIHENQANHEQSQLETCLTYKEECLNGLKTAKDSGLSIVQIRECQLLVQYIDSVVETRQYKADISQENYEEAKAVWQEKQDSLENLKQALKKLEAEYGEQIIDDIKPVHDRNYIVYDGRK
jgi:flagellar biosynthesis chaperone FliJ